MQGLEERGRAASLSPSPGPVWSGLASDELTCVQPAGNMIPSFPSPFSVTRTATLAPEQLPILLESPVFLLGW